MVTASSTGGRVRGPGATTPWGTVAELALGALMLGTAALGGLIFVHRPWPNRLDAFGCGMYSPIASNEAEIGRAKNRRVEVKLMTNVAGEMPQQEKPSGNPSAAASPSPSSR